MVTLVNLLSLLTGLVLLVGCGFAFEFGDQMWGVHGFAQQVGTVLFCLIVGIVYVDGWMNKRWRTLKETGKAKANPAFFLIFFLSHCALVIIGAVLPLIEPQAHRLGAAIIVTGVAGIVAAGLWRLVKHNEILTVPTGACGDRPSSC